MWIVIAGLDSTDQLYSFIFCGRATVKHSGANDRIEFICYAKHFVGS